MQKTSVTGAVMVVGGGIGGMQAALDLAESGFKVYLVEEQSAIGGNMARLDKTFPTNDCSMCIMSPKLVEAGRHLDIEIITGAQLQSLEGEPGNFTARVLQRPRYVDVDECTGCGDCRDVCPVSLPNPFEAGLGNRKAIDRLYAQATPSAFEVSKLGDPPCRETCPAGCNVQGYVALIAEGRFDEALGVIDRTLPFPGILGRVCHHPCEESCNRGQIDGQPVSICRLKRAATEYRELEPQEIPQPTIIREQKVAVVGAGPAGLTAALDLAREGHPVTVFDAMEEPGGTMRFTIPAYRLPEEVAKKETEGIFERYPHLEFRGGQRLGHDFTLEDLEEQGYSSVILALGTTVSRSVSTPGEDLPGVRQGLEFLREARKGQVGDISGRVVVIGGGNVAVDCARSAVRMGAEEVVILYRRTQDEMPAYPWEIEEALEEGVIVREHRVVEEFLGDQKLERLKIGGMKPAPGSEKRGRLVVDESVQEELEAHLVLLAIGQDADLTGLSGSDIEEEWGLLKVDPLTLATSREGVFAAGDVVSGPASVVEAIAGGHEAAESVRRYLAGQDLCQGREKPQPQELGVPEGISPYPARRQEPRMAHGRPGDFSQVDPGLTLEQAQEEAKRCLNCALCCECLECIKACEKDCIFHDMTEKTLDLEIGAVVMTPGVTTFDAGKIGEFGYGRYPNVITSIEFERMLSASGPYGGEVVRPSDGGHPKRIAFIQCAGSRDPERGLPYCSSVCCMYTAKEAVMAMDHAPGLETTVFYMDIRAYGKDFESYYENAQALGVRYIRSMVSTVKEVPGTQELKVRYIADDGSRHEETFDMVILAVGLVPSESTQELASRVGLDLNEHGFCQQGYFTPTVSSRPGVFVAGGFGGPQDIPETVVGASGAAGEAAKIIAPARGSLIREKEYPPERDISDQEPRIGVFVCNCGRNIGAVVRVPEVVEHARGLRDVVYATEFLYACSQDSIEQIKQAVEEHGLNRVVVASCTPRTHEPLFQDTIREAGLNPHLFDMANIRDQCSWVHSRQPQEATQKSKILTSMAVAKARLLEPAHPSYFEVDQRCLIIGGGAAGLAAALSVAEQGLEAYVIEREEELGGNLRHVHYTMEGQEVGPFLESLISRAQEHPRIRIYSPAEVLSIGGHVGNFQVNVRMLDTQREIQLNQGAIIVATGASEAVVDQYGRGQDARVITGRELEEKLQTGQELGDSFVFIQCAGSREPGREYCSRICCSQALKNALMIKRRNPEAMVHILYRELRSYGFKEEYYRQARELGIRFVRFDLEGKPQVQEGKVRVPDGELGEDLEIEADWVVISPGMDPQEGTEELAQMLKVPLNSSGFFLEAHMKLRPVDFATEGIFLCGLAHAPKMLDESLAQASAAALRAVALLSKGQLESHSLVAQVREKWCAACGLCVEACPYEARVLDEEEKVARVVDVLCQGCGACSTACPNGATWVKGFSRKQILSMVEAALD